MDIKECKYNPSNKSVEVLDKAKAVQFTFELERQKSTVSDKEQLAITCNKGGIKLGTGIAKPNSLMEDLLSFKQFGVILPRKVYADISREIENNYHLLTPNYSNLHNELTDTTIKNIFLMFCDYIDDFDIKAVTNKKKVTTYNIPVSEFLEYLTDSDFRIYDSTAVRDGLRNHDYTVCNTGRNDNTIFNAETNKAMKVISFKAAKVKPESIV